MTGSGAERRFTHPVVRSVDADDGVPLLYRAWEVDQPRGCVRIVHGLGEHGRRYGHLAGALHQRGISVYAADLRGHGVSVVGSSVSFAVGRSIYLEANAAIQLQALGLGGAVVYLTPEETERVLESGENRGYERPWELWKKQALSRDPKGR